MPKPVSSSNTIINHLMQHPKRKSVIVRTCYFARDGLFYAAIKTSIKNFSSVLLVTLLVSLKVTSALAGNTLYIYNPSYVKAHTMQKKISTLCPDMQISVYGKAKDFKKQIQLVAPDAAITLPVVIDQYSDYKLLLKGEKSESFEEAYFLVSVDNPVSKADLAGKKIGVIDLLGRKPMAAFIKPLLGDVSIKRVAKAEDLLSLLNFKVVDALFISASDLESLKKSTQLNLQTTNTEIHLGLTIIAHRSSAQKSAISNCVAAFDHTVNDYLRVEKWKAAQ